MPITHDWFDWLSGLPRGVARPEEVFRFCCDRGCDLRNLKTVNGRGASQLIFFKE